MNAADKKDHLVKDSLILFVASSVVNASNFVFHMYATRNLKPEDYGVLATLLAMIWIFTMPAASLQISVVKKVSSLQANEKFGSIERLFTSATLWFLIIAMVSFLVLVAASKLIGNFFHIEDTMLIVILGGIIVISFALPVVRGVLQGMQKFVGLGVNMAVDSLFRLAFLVAFIAAGFGVRGALATTLCSGTSAYIIGLFTISALFKYKQEEVQIIEKSELFGYAVPVFLALLGASFLSYMDLLMVKHFFSREQAGFYAVTSIIGKAFLFFPSAIIIALFPKVAAQVELNKNPRAMLFKSVGLTAAVSSAGIIFCFIFPEFVLRLLTGGDRYFAIAGIVKLFGLAILPLVLLNVVINYSLASKKYNFIYVLYSGIAVYAGLLWFFHSSFYTVLSILFGVNTVVLILSMLSLKYDNKAAATK